MLAALQALAANDCLLSGLCLVRNTGPAGASGVMFMAVGLVALGVLGLRRRPGRPDRNPAP